MDYARDTNTFVTLHLGTCWRSYEKRVNNGDLGMHKMLRIVEDLSKNTNNFLRKVFSQTIISYVSSYNKRLTWIRLRLREQGSESPQFCWIFDNSWPGQGVSSHSRLGLTKVLLFLHENYAHANCPWMMILEVCSDNILNKVYLIGII